MSGKVHKKIRKVARKQLVIMIRQIGKLPFRQRLWFAWRILKGTKKR